MAQNKITLTIDHTEVVADSGATVLEAALAGGIYIPHLCYHPDLEPAGVCRLCMVEIEGRGLTIACRAPVAEGLVVRTESPEIDKVRRVAMELLIANHHVDCLACAQNNQCAIQKTAAYIGISETRLDALFDKANEDGRLTNHFTADEFKPWPKLEGWELSLAELPLR